MTRDHTYFERLKGKPNRVELQASTTKSDTLRRSEPVEPDVQSHGPGRLFVRAPDRPLFRVLIAHQPLLPGPARPSCEQVT